MTAARSMGLIILLFAAMLLLASLYTVQEGHHGLLLRLGKLELNKDTGKPDVKAPGLHFKWPFINQARIFDTRLQTLDIQSSRIVTEEKKDVLVDYYVKWRIADLPLYYTRTSGNELQAETLLEQKLNDSLRAQFGQRNIREVVSGERSDIMAVLQKQAHEGGKNLGINVIDVRIKRIDLPTEVSNAVFDRMRAERERIANQHRADGKAAAEAIRAAADANVTVILAKARREEKVLRGQGEAKAAEIYAKAYNRDREFFAFYRSMEAYQDVFSKKQDVLLLKPDSEFFKYFNRTKSPRATS